MNTFIAIALWLSAVVGAAYSGEASPNYCDKSLCFSGTHIACGHNYQFDRSCPKNARLVSITPQLKQIILHLHNEKRNHVAGGNAPKHRPACRMSTMQWDDELAKLAELNVMQCKMNPDECHNTNSFALSGQNLEYYSFFNNTVDDSQMFSAAIESWYKQIRNSNMRIINQFPKNYTGPPIKQFADLVTDSNNRVGCAAATYTREGLSFATYLMACNMATTTMENKLVYDCCRMPGRKCETGKHSYYSNLCNTTEIYKLRKLRNKLIN